MSNEERLVLRAAAESAGANDEIMLAMTPHAALCVIGQLQLALRHPANNGVVADYVAIVIRSLIQQLNDAGFTATAELAALGNNDDFMIF